MFRNLTDQAMGYMPQLAKHQEVTLCARQASFSKCSSLSMLVKPDQSQRHSTALGLLKDSINLKPKVSYQQLPPILASAMQARPSGA